MVLQKQLSYSNFIIVLLIASIFGTSGSILQISGTNWDIVSHLLLNPETFFTPSHLLLYSGVGLLILSSFLYVILIIKFKEFLNNKIIKRIRLLLVGSILSIVAGPLDFLWHQTLGVDGLLSPTHLILGIGILFSSIGIVVILFEISKIHVSTKQKHMIQTMMIVGLISLWLTSISFIYLFSLPISKGERFNFNLPFIAESIIALISLPFTNSIIFTVALRKFRKFGPASLIGCGVFLINSITNILPSHQLSYFLPYYLVSIIPFVIADLIFNKKVISTTDKKISFDYSILIVGVITGSMFYILGYPLLPLSLANNLLPIDLEKINFQTLNDIIPSFDGSLSFMLFISFVIGGLLGSLASGCIAGKFVFYKGVIRKLSK